MKPRSGTGLCFDLSLFSKGNRVRLLKGGGEAYPRMLESIASARHSVLMEMYTFASDATGLRFARAMAERARAGVAVRLLYDSLGSRDTSTSIFQFLRAAGARVTPFRPWGRFTWRRRDHRKLVIVDGRLAFVGGLNVSDAYAPESEGGQNWRDTQIEIEGPEVGDLVSLFAEVWGEERDEDLFPAGAPPAPEPVSEGVPVAAIGSERRRMRKVIGTSYLHALLNARRRIWIENAYFVPSLKFSRALRRAALQGVDVRILIPYRTDLWPVYYATRALLDGMLKRGIRIFEYHGPILHAKTSVIDGYWSSVGSYNLDHLSMFHNYEATAIVLSRDFGAQMEAMFAEDCGRSVEVTRDRWRRRPLRLRALEQFWFAFRSLM
ncbi:MAG: cardiolipin synthase ClsB [Planctomycetes bacterium]|nr:cardiolipin synthase ClsB [Planctomycetota bacterium]